MFCPVIILCTLTLRTLDIVLRERQLMNWEWAYYPC
jgi:hypothetical protein